MALRMHPLSASRWAELAASRHPIDLTDGPTPPTTAPDRARPDRARQRRAEHARIQATVDALTTARAPASR